MSRVEATCGAAAVLVRVLVAAVDAVADVDALVDMDALAGVDALADVASTAALAFATFCGRGVSIAA